MEGPWSALPSPAGGTKLTRWGPPHVFFKGLWSRWPHGPLPQGPGHLALPAWLRVLWGCPGRAFRYGSQSVSLERLPVPAPLAGCPVGQVKCWHGTRGGLSTSLSLTVPALPLTPTWHPAVPLCPPGPRLWGAFPEVDLFSPAGSPTPVLLGVIAKETGPWPGSEDSRCLCPSNGGLVRCPALTGHLV